MIACAVVWGLPFNASGWVEHHRFLFGQARYPRILPATPAGFLALGGRAAGQLPVTLGWPILLGAAFAMARPALWKGLAPRALGQGLYTVGFLGVIGYVYPRFLLPLILLALPLAIRGWNTLLERAGPLRVPVIAVLLGLTAAGGPLLGAAQLRDTRYQAAERLGALLPIRGTGSRPPSVEIVGNPRFQARVPPGYAVTTIAADTLGRVAGGPTADVVLMSSFDRYLVQNDPVLRRAWLDRLVDPRGDYEMAWDTPPPRWSRPVRGLPFSPVIWGWARRPEKPAAR